MHTQPHSPITSHQNLQVGVPIIITYVLVVAQASGD